MDDIVKTEENSNFVDIPNLKLEYEEEEIICSFEDPEPYHIQKYENEESNEGMFILPHDEFKCMKCSELFIDESVFANHLENCTNENWSSENSLSDELKNQIAVNSKETTIEPQKSKEASKTPTYEISQCTFCGKTFKHILNNMKALRNHTKSAHNFLLENHPLDRQQKNRTRKILKKDPNCLICQTQVFSSQSESNSHLAIHRKFKSFKCPVCEEILLNQLALNSHLKFKHSIKSTFVCDFCHMSFKDLNFALTHIFIHFDDLSYKCQVCDLQFRHKSYFKSHLPIHKEIISVNCRCNLCCQDFQDEVGLNSHYKFCKKVNPFHAVKFISVIVSKESKNVKLLTEFTNKVYNDEETNPNTNSSKSIAELSSFGDIENQSSDENESSNEPIYYSRSRRKIKPKPEVSVYPFVEHECENCHEQFYKKSSLLAHAKECELGEKRRKLSETQSDPLASSTEPGNLEKEKNSNDNSESDESTRSIKSSKSDQVNRPSIKNSLRCLTCHNEFLSNSDLKIHGENWHGQTDENSKRRVCLNNQTVGCWKCQNHVFQNRLCLNAHLAGIHPNKKVFECSKCKFNFLGFKQLCEHYKENHCVKNFKKSFVCDYCDKTLSFTSEAKNHMESHYQYSTFICDLCDRFFKSRHLFEYHLTIHDGEISLSCECHLCCSIFTEVLLDDFDLHVEECKKNFLFDPFNYISIKLVNQNETPNPKVSETFDIPPNLVLVPKAGEESLKTPKPAMTNEPKIHRKLKRKYKCPKCELEFCQRIQFVTHLEWDHQSNSSQKSSDVITLD